MGNPCHYCQHYRESYRNNEGWEYGCDAEKEFAILTQKPCPYFKPHLPSDRLLEQLADEKHEQFERECEEQWKKWLRDNDADI